MTAKLLDASALIALLFEEPGADDVAQAVSDGAAMSAVNIAEVAATLYQDNWSDEDVSSIVDDLGIQSIAFDDACALISGQLRPKTKPLGLGIGDRACLATAQLHNLDILTADQIWQKVKLKGVKIQCIR